MKIESKNGDRRANAEGQADLVKVSAVIRAGGPRLQVRMRRGVPILFIHILWVKLFQRLRPYSHRDDLGPEFSDRSYNRAVGL